MQYQESDLAFLQRLLEEEGVTYHFEHGADTVTLVLTDADAGRLRLDPFDALGPNTLDRHLDKWRLGGRLRPKQVKLTAFNWEKPTLDMTASVESSLGSGFVVRHPGRYSASPDQGKPLADVQLQQLRSEARYATAQGSCRLLDAGTVFAVEHPRTRYSGEYLVTKVEMQGRAEGELPPGYDAVAFSNDGPFHTRVECVRRGSDNVEESQFRPVQRTACPRIHGSQTAIVTDDPDARGAEIHVGGPPGQENGCVRLKFHWDIETERHKKESTSCWVRVSQALAGAGGGAVWHPRVGTEVIVDFLDGDPDRPIVVGRVYNGQQPAAASGKGAATSSTFKSLSSPGGDVFNEFGFDDTAGKEQFKIHAGKDWNCNVGNDRNETIDNNSSSSVSVDRSEDTGGNRTTKIDGNNQESVSGDEETMVSGNQTIGVSSNQVISVSGTRDLAVGGSHTITTGPETKTVKGAQGVTVTSTKTENVSAVYGLTVGAAMNINVGAAMNVSAGATYGLSAPIATIAAPVYTVSCSAGTIQGADVKVIGSGTLVLQGADITIAAGGTLTLSGATVNIKGGTVNVEGGTTNVAGGTTNVTGGSVNVN